MKHIPYAHQSVNEEDISAVIEVLRSDWLTQGPAIGKFESAVAGYCDAEYALATCNATSALHLACLAVGLGPGDVLWTSPNTFVASASCAIMCGASVDFVDIDPETFNISVDALEEKLEENRKSGEKLPKIVMPVHFAGLPCDMDSIKQLSDEYGFKIIEDASHAIGSEYNNHKTGSCYYSDITVFSFHPAKIITTGEGGMALTNNRNFHDRMLLLRTHGITRNENEMTGTSHGPWYYEQLALGYNYRLSDIHAVLGTSQMNRIDDYIVQRRNVVNTYNAGLIDLPIKLPSQYENAESSHHLYVVRLKTGVADISRMEFITRLHNNGIMVNVHYIPVYKQPIYRQLGFPDDYCPTAEDYYQEAVSLPIFPDLSREMQDYVIDSIKKVLI